MAIRQLRYEGDPCLRQKCKPVLEVDDHIRRILQDMADTMCHVGNAAGLAANQVGLLKQLVVIDMGQGRICLVNPVIVASQGTQECIEGCLSFPGRWGQTIRPAKVTVEALDENGEPVTLTGEGDFAKCLCHEIDHLNGIVFTQKVVKYVVFD